MYTVMKIKKMLMTVSVYAQHLLNYPSIYRWDCWVQLMLHNGKRHIEEALVACLGTQGFQTNVLVNY